MVVSSIEQTHQYIACYAEYRRANMNPAQSTVPLDRTIWQSWLAKLLTFTMILSPVALVALLFWFVGR
jgi:hypothetical protein